MRNAAAPARNSFWFQYLSLFTSLGTLLCCALPSLLVLFGLGATVASVLSAAPWLVKMSKHKDWTFAVAGLLIGANFVYVYAVAPRFKERECAVGEDACGTASRFSTTVLWISTGLYAAGVFVAFVLGPIFMWLDHSQ